ncbi:hypothetical protein D9619_011457 [Psilocybe cf. subviscida]|uniref:HMG box domain-containing protein n=1 Tax=Psilocybe cf. subviscida TaxID=2480587 RepID=A0A8H5F9W7_9AGAR|nr:hypothetical protein D9619_011457 [Psilocybe cf. subviscida]
MEKLSIRRIDGEDIEDGEEEEVETVPAETFVVYSEESEESDGTNHEASSEPETDVGYEAQHELDDEDDRASLSDGDAKDGASHLMPKFMTSRKSGGDFIEEPFFSSGAGLESEDGGDGDPYLLQSEQEHPDTSSCGDLSEAFDGELTPLSESEDTSSGSDQAADQQRSPIARSRFESEPDEASGSQVLPRDGSAFATDCSAKGLEDGELLPQSNAAEDGEIIEEESEAKGGEVEDKGMAAQSKWRRGRKRPLFHDGNSERPAKRARLAFDVEADWRFDAADGKERWQEIINIAPGPSACYDAFSNLRFDAQSDSSSSDTGWMGRIMPDRDLATLRRLWRSGELDKKVTETFFRYIVIKLTTTLYDARYPQPLRPPTVFNTGECSCATGYIRRPRNPFICFRSQFVASMAASGLWTQHQLSKLAGEAWGKMSHEERRPFTDMAAAEKIQHAIDYPDYIYIPGAAKRSKSKCPAAACKCKARAWQERLRSQMPDWDSVESDSPESASFSQSPSTPHTFGPAVGQSTSHLVQDPSSLSASSHRSTACPDDGFISFLSALNWIADDAAAGDISVPGLTEAPSPCLTFKSLPMENLHVPSIPSHQEHNLLMPSFWLDRPDDTKDETIPTLPVEANQSFDSSSTSSLFMLGNTFTTDEMFFDGTTNSSTPLPLLPSTTPFGGVALEPPTQPEHNSLALVDGNNGLPFGELNFLDPSLSDQDIFGTFDFSLEPSATVISFGNLPTTYHSVPMDTYTWFRIRNSENDVAGLYQDRQEELEAPDPKRNHSTEMIKQRAIEKERSREASQNQAYPIHLQHPPTAPARRALW